MNEWGIPDWRDPAAYGDAKRWGFWRWRWEFYRRRDDLREVFLFVSEKESDDPELTELVTQGRPPRGQPGHYVCANTKRMFGYHEKLPDPSVSAHPEELLFAWDHLPPVMSEWTRNDGKAVTWPGMRIPATNFALVVFDLDKPLESQFFAAKRHACAMQEFVHGQLLQRRRHPAKWLGYLRALDAREADASWAEIAELFHAQGLLGRRKDPAGGYSAPPPQAARDMWEAADDLRFNF